VKRPVFASLLALLVAGSAAAQPGAPTAQEPDPRELDCLIEPRERVVLAAPVIGVVESVLVDRGDLVEPGQVVATLEASIERATVEAARARAEATADVEGSESRLVFETRRRDRSQQLLKEGVASDNALDEAESAWVLAKLERDRARELHEIAKLDLARAEAALGVHSLRSPVRGVVVRRILAPGEYADPPQVLELAQIDPLYVEVFAPVRLLGKIEVGQDASVLPEAPVGGNHAAKVIVVDPVVDAASGTFGVRLELPNPEHAVPAGLKCRVRF
jgi:membrane fusion protein (multidrug efflux system)